MTARRADTDAAAAHHRGVQATAHDRHVQVNSAPARAVATSPAERARLRAGLGGLLRWERLAAGLRQRGLAARVGYGLEAVKHLEAGSRRPSESSTRRLAEALRPGGDPVEVARLDLELQRAAGESLLRWNRTRAWSVQRRRIYEQAAAELDTPRPVAAGELAAWGRLVAGLAPRWEPPRG